MRSYELCHPVSTSDDDDEEEDDDVRPGIYRVLRYILGMPAVGALRLQAMKPVVWFFMPNRMEPLS